LVANLKFFKPNNPLFTPKIQLFDDYFALFGHVSHGSMYLMAREGFIYTIAADIYAFRLAFSTILHCVLHHFTLHLAPKRTAFCIKTHCV